MVLAQDETFVDPSSPPRRYPILASRPEEEYEEQPTGTYLFLLGLPAEVTARTRVVMPETDHEEDLTEVEDPSRLSHLRGTVFGLTDSIEEFTGLPTDLAKMVNFFSGTNFHFYEGSRAVDFSHGYSKLRDLTERSSWSGPFIERIEEQRDLLVKRFPHSTHFIDLSEDTDSEEEEEKKEGAEGDEERSDETKVEELSVSATEEKRRPMMEFPRERHYPSPEAEYQIVRNNYVFMVSQLAQINYIKNRRRIRSPRTKKQKIIHLH